MDKIESFEELEVLKDIISKAKNKTSNDSESGIFDGKNKIRRLCQERSQKNNDAYKELPEQIEISSDIAKFLASTEAIHINKLNAIDEKYDPIAGMFKIIISIPVAVLFPSPGSILNLANTAHNTYKTIKENDAASTIVWNERNHITETILASYLLTEFEPGKYALKRGHWAALEGKAQTGRGEYWAMKIKQVNIGLDPKLDYSKLLPDRITYNPRSDSDGFKLG
jgi:hypothetical protein